MTPLNAALTELRLAIERAEVRAEVYAEAPTGHATFDSAGWLSDHRVEVAGDMADALDRIAPGMGQRFMQALYPELDLGLEHFMELLTSIGQPLPAALAHDGRDC